MTITIQVWTINMMKTPDFIKNQSNKMINKEMMTTFQAKLMLLSQVKPKRSIKERKVMQSQVILILNSESSKQ